MAVYLVGLANGEWAIETDSIVQAAYTTAWERMCFGLINSLLKSIIPSCATLYSDRTFSNLRPSNFAPKLNQHAISIVAPLSEDAISIRLRAQGCHCAFRIKNRRRPAIWRKNREVVERE